MNPKNGPAFASLMHHREDRDFQYWLEHGGRERVAAMKARFEAEAKRHKPPEFETYRTANGTLYRVLKRSEAST